MTPEITLGANTIAASASITSKTCNQDACRTFANAKAGLRGVVVADGLGSHYRADVGSTIAVTFLANALERIESPAATLDMAALYADVNAALTSHVLQLSDLPTDLDLERAFGTTLLCVADTPTALIVAYVGNGAVLHVRGDFNAFPSTQLLPWSAVNVLSPHATSERGRNVLYKFLGPRARHSQITPTVLTISKDRDLFGDIVIACTDGIASQDQTPIGTDDEQQIWVRGDTAVAILYERLASFFGSIQPPSDASLTRALEQYLATLSARNLVSDDCTVGVVICPTALEYQTRRAAAEQEPASV